VVVFNSEAENNALSKQIYRTHHIFFAVLLDKCQSFTFFNYLFNISIAAKRLFFCLINERIRLFMKKDYKHIHIMTKNTTV